MVKSKIWLHLINMDHDKSQKNDFSKEPKDDNGIHVFCANAWVEAHKVNHPNPFGEVCKDCAPIIANMGWIP